MISLLIKPISEFMGSAFGKLTIIAALAASIAGIYALYDARDMAEKQILIEKGRAEVIEQNYKITLETNNAKIKELNERIEEQQRAIEKFSLEKEKIETKVTVIRKSIDSVKTDKELTAKTQEIMKCLSGC